MVASQTSGELALMRLMQTVWSRRYASPKRISDIRTVSFARSGWVTEPI